jgi:hypothetical protein
LLAAIGILVAGAVGPACADRRAGPTPLDEVAPPKRGETDSAGGSSIPLREHADDVADYTLRARLDPSAHSVHAEGLVRWRNASGRAVRELWFHLYLNAFKNERSAFLRERVGGRGSQPADDWGFIDVTRLTWVQESGARVDLLPFTNRDPSGDGDETEARADLPREIAPGEAVDLEIAFDDKLPSIVERTGYRGSFHMIGQWFPKLARLEPDGTWAHFPFHHLAEFYADFGTYDVTLDVPSSFVIGATGPAVEARVEGGRRIERHLQGDVHDFAWTAWDRWGVRRERISGVDVTVLFPPGFGAIAERELAALRFALPFDSAHFGAYPYSVLTVAHPQNDAREAGGMEYPTLITSGGEWWCPSSVAAPEIVTVHELGHQWFYGLVATDEARWPFLDEGVNEFVETDVMAHYRGEGSAADLFGLHVSDAAIQAVFSERAVHDEPVGQRAAAFSTGSNYGRLVYGRTAAILETLARVYGRDRVEHALGRYARTWRFRHPSPADLECDIAAEAGAAAQGLFHAAVFDRGWVDYAVERVVSTRAQTPAGVYGTPARRESLARGDPGAWEGEALVRRRGTLALPVEIELHGADGETRRERWDGAGDFVRVAWHGSSALTAAVVDPDDRILIDEDPLNNRATASDERRRAWTTLDRAAYVLQLALQAVGL